MPRRPRMYIPGIRAHILQRGNNHQAVFFCEDDYHYYLFCLDRMAKRYGVQLHAYVLMTNPSLPHEMLWVRTPSNNT